MLENDQSPIDLAQIDQDLRGRALDKQKAALDRLAQVPADVAVPLLARLLESGDFMHRRMAVMGLGNHRVEDSFQLLAGVIAKDLGWVNFWGFTIIAAIPGMVLLWMLWRKGYVVESIRQPSSQDDG